MKSESSTEMPSSPSPRSPTCEYDLVYLTVDHPNQRRPPVACRRLVRPPVLCSVTFPVCDCLQRSEHELSDFDSNDWTEHVKSAETVGEPADEECAHCKKPAKTQVRERSCALLSGFVT